MLQTPLPAIRTRMVSGPSELPFPTILIRAPQGRRPRRSQPGRMALGVEELRFRTAQRAGTKGRHSPFLPLFLKPAYSEDRQRSAGGRFFLKSRNFANRKVKASAAPPSAPVECPAKPHRTSMFICVTVNRQGRFEPVFPGFSAVAVLGSAPPALLERLWNGLRRYRELLTQRSDAAGWRRWSC